MEPARESLAKNPWIAHRRPSSQARIRLFCFPYAGGSATIYRRWQGALPPEIEILPVELPGRASRFREAPFARLAPLIEALGEGLVTELVSPYVFFGHSMGALVAYELTRWLSRQRVPGPELVIASGRRAPHIPPDEEPYHDLPDPEFRAKLHELGGTPREILEHPELMDMLIPILRADFAVHETYRHQSGEPISAPLAAYGGLADPEVSKDHLQGWGRHTSGAFRVRMFAGGHFFLDRDPVPLQRAIAEEILTTVL